MFRPRNTHIHTYISTYIHSQMHTYMHTFMHTRVPAGVHACVHAYPHDHMQVNAHMRRCLCLDTLMHKYTRACAASTCEQYANNSKLCLAAGLEAVRQVTTTPHAHRRRITSRACKGYKPKLSTMSVSSSSHSINPSNPNPLLSPKVCLTPPFLGIWDERHYHLRS